MGTLSSQYPVGSWWKEVMGGGVEEYQCVRSQDRSDITRGKVLPLPMNHPTWIPETTKNITRSGPESEVVLKYRHNPTTLTLKKKKTTIEWSLNV